MKRVVVRASAGTGKTYALTGEYLKLLLRGEDPRQILATTFTRKAAAEIQSRIFLRLASAVDNEQKREELQIASGMNLNSEAILKALRSLVSVQHALQICTLDSFFIQVAKMLSLELGMGSSWDIADASQNDAIVAESIRILCGSHDTPDGDLRVLIRLLQQSQFRRAVYSDLIRVADQLFDLHRESEEAAWKRINATGWQKNEQTEKALQEFQNYTLPQTKTGKPNSYWARAREAILEAVINGSWLEFLRNGLIQVVLNDGDQFARKEIDAELRKILSPLISHASAVFLDQLAQQNTATRLFLSAYHTVYQDLRFQRSNYGFDDVKYILALASLSPFQSELYFRLNTKIQHLLLDEFQDTSRLEWLVLQPLTEEILSDPEEYSEFFCVGDTKQAIYGWRGGVAEIFDRLTDSPYDIKTEHLDKSYRNDPEIIRLVNLVFENLEKNRALSSFPEIAKIWSSEFRAHQTVNTENKGFVQIDSAEDEESCFQQSAETVQQLVKDYPGKSIGVLLRKKASVADMRYRIGLGPNGVISSEEGGNPLTDSPAVCVLLSLLYLLDHPGDSVSLYHLQSAIPGGYPGLQEKNLSNFIIAQRQSLFQEGYGGYLELQAEKIRAYCGARDQRRVSRLIQIGYEFQSTTPGHTTEFYNHILSTPVEDPSTADIRVMTLHASKGLEFDIVVLPELDFMLSGAVRDEISVYRPDPVGSPETISHTVESRLRVLDPRFEEMHQQSTTAKVRESLCLLYVALTRARHGIYIATKYDQQSQKNSSTAGAVVVEAIKNEESQKNTEQTIFFSGVLPEKESQQSIALDRVEQAGLKESKTIFAPSPKFRTRGLFRKSPSKQEGGGAYEVGKAFQHFSAEAALRGRIMHRCFEEVEWLDEQDLDEAYFLNLLEQEFPEASSYKEFVDSFLSALENPDLEKLLSLSRYKNNSENLSRQNIKAEREYSFAYREENSIITGMIDRLVLIDSQNKLEKAEIIDFKTDRIGNSKELLEERIEYYQPQIESYKKAIEHTCQVPANKISGTLVFLNPVQIVSL